ncbi:MAG: MBL fold metallo-hydrolase [Haliangiales bacterium]
MRVTFWGVRGSIPAPGPETNRYGGNTSCVSVTTGRGELIIIDMGTGLVPLGAHLLQSGFGKGEGQATLLLSHSHWDHIQGFPFFPPVFIPGNQFVLHGNAKSASMLEGILEGQMNPHFSPLYTLKNLGAAIEFRSVTRGAYFDAGGVRVCAQANPHGNITALAFRLEEDGKSFVYASDVGYPDEGPGDAILDLYRDADMLLHDCTYTPEDQATRRNRGFSSYADAAGAAVRANAKHLVMFHYDQDYTDDDVDRLRERCRAELDRLGGESIQLTPAAEGMTLEI